MDYSNLYEDLKAANFESAELWFQYFNFASFIALK
jgi:hypothetical protein